MARLVLVYNPNSSQYCHLKKDVLDKKAEIFEKYFAGYELDFEYTVKKIGFEKNVEQLSREIRDGDTLLALGGDATAAIAANAVLTSQKDATLGVLPYGNFNDLARTLETMKLSAFEKRKVATLYPLEIFVDKKFWRYATCYVTIGMTAEAVELFDNPKFRKYMQGGHKSSWRSYLELMKWYFKNRRKKGFLPEFMINGMGTAKGASDYAAVNGKSMCRVMKGGEDFLIPKVFRSTAIKTVSFPRLFMLMARAILIRTPGKETKGDLLEFLKPATVELQAEGEYQIFKNISEIEVKKSGRKIKVIMREK